MARRLVGLCSHRRCSAAVADDEASTREVSAMGEAMADTLELRPFAEADFTELKRWFVDQAALTTWGGPGLVHPLDDSQLSAMLDDPHSEPPRRVIWAVKHGTAMIGHGQIVLGPERASAHLARIAVAPEWRGRGVGEWLVRALLSKAFETASVGDVTLKVYVHNHAAHKLYEKLGFRLASPEAGVVDGVHLMTLPRAGWSTT